MMFSCLRARDFKKTGVTSVMCHSPLDGLEGRIVFQIRLCIHEGTEKVPLPHKNGNNTRLKSCICQYFFVPLHKNKAYVTATERT